MNKTPDILKMRKWQLAAINHLEDIGHQASVIKDVPPEAEMGGTAMVCAVAILPEDKASAFASAVANLLERINGDAVETTGPLFIDKEGVAH